MAALPRIHWRVPAYLPYLQPPLTDDTLRSANRHLGFPLPSAYVAAIREQNGGYLRYKISGFGADQLWGIGPRFPSILLGSIKDRHCDDGGWMPTDAEALVPFVGDGHWYLCFDARDGRAEPAITYVDLECASSQRAAETFAEVIADLGPDDDDFVIGIATTTSLSRAAQALGDALRMTVTDQGDWAHGYPTLHGRVQRGDTIAQFWLTPNEVPRGFVRKDDRDYATLVDLLPGTALRVPEHPDCNLLLEASEVPDEELLAACSHAGLQARGL